MRRFSSALRALALHVEGLLHHMALEDGAAVRTHEDTLGLESLEVSADGHPRDAQVFAERRHPDGPAFLDQVDDAGATLRGDHLVDFRDF